MMVELAWSLPAVAKHKLKLSVAASIPSMFIECIAPVALSYD